MGEIKIVRSVPFTGCTGCEDWLMPEPETCDFCLLPISEYDGHWCERLNGIWVWREHR